ncbi:MAG: TonB-dependent receptor [Gammaproteobacteria bacterium]|nr:TonB-dependent receptor [Gammaproteobacteria bacterium]MDH3372544.1 TonB-dependent receptor [Gammaproteobacteria bacterium]MDH3408289.1 TonB-dependent receptor [Gammaproteobacteria bacterium]MDH3552074.1 TonB-dependent receptor [Gammaproteobacteria bacterium]
MQTSQPRKLSALAAIAIASSPVAVAQGQEDGPRVLDEITVTAAYREQGLQDVPVSISAVTGDIMTASALQKAEDIQFLVPNFTLTETGIGTNAFIRGIGSGINQAFEQSVGTYVDGVYFGRAQQWRAPFLDIERVEVLRGPQSILFGKNSVAGALNITSAKPTQEFEGSVLVSWEFEDNESILEGMISGPISDRVRYRVAARSRNLDGHMYNLTTEEDEPLREDWAVRGTLEFDVSDALTATLKAEVGEFEVTGRHIEIINEQPAIPPSGFAGLPYHRILQTLQQLSGGSPDPDLANVVQDEVRTSNGDFSNNESENFVLTLDWALGDYDLKSITAYSNFEYDEFCDCDFTGAEVFGAALQEQYEQISQEFRLSSPLGSSFDYIAGLYYQTSEHDFADQIIVSPTSLLITAVNLQSTGTPTAGAGNLVANTFANRIATVDNDVLSAFAQVNWHLNDAFTLQAGGRITNDQRDGFRSLTILGGDGGPLPAAQLGAPLVYASAFEITSTNLNTLALAPDPTGAQARGLIAAFGDLPVEGSRDKTKFSPEVKLIWDANDDALFYLSWSKGFKSGSFDFRANNRSFYPDMASSFEFEDEEATNTELGTKLTLAGGAFELNGALFFTKFDNLQISIFDGRLGFNVGNAASAEVFGAEMDMRWAASDYLTVTGGLAYTDFEFTDFENGQCYFGATPDVDLDGNGTPELCSYTGNSNQLVSDLQGNFSFDIRVPVGRDLELHTRFDIFYTDDYDASSTFDPKLVQDAYTMLNARVALGAEDGKWEVALLAKNLTDEKILTFGGDTPLATTTFFAQSNYAFYSTGEQLSLQARVRF